MAELRRDSSRFESRSDRKRPFHSSNEHQTEQLDRTVYVTNLPREKISDQELIDFFSPFGKISDIRVFKDHFLVQYQRVEQANDLIEQGKRSLTLRSKQLEIRRASEVRSILEKSSSKERSSSRDEEPGRKRFLTKHHLDSVDLLNQKDRHSIESKLDYPQHLYSILSGPKTNKEAVDCQILIVNMRQRNYAEEIESRLISVGLRTSIRLLREDFTLTDAIENAGKEQSLYAIIAMPMHEERRTASFHILYGQTEEHRNLSVTDGLTILSTKFASYKEHLRQLELSSSNEILYSTNGNSNGSTNSLPTLTINDRFPLSMLLCLLADGRQLTLDEIDRILVYLLEKKAKMLTLPSGTLPPLPAQYATKFSTKIEKNSGNQSNEKILSDSSLPSNIAEQLRQLLSNNHSMERNSSSLENLVKVEQTNHSSINGFNRDLNENFSQSSNRESQQTIYSNNLLPATSFQQCSTPNISQSVNPMIASTFSSFSSTSNPSSLSQPSDFLYSQSAANLYSFPLNSSLTNPIFQSFAPISSLSLLNSSTSQTKQEK